MKQNLKRTFGKMANEKEPKGNRAVVDVGPVMNGHH